MPCLQTRTPHTSPSTSTLVCPLLLTRVTSRMKDTNINSAGSSRVPSQSSVGMHASKGLGGSAPPKHRLRVILGTTDPAPAQERTAPSARTPSLLLGRSLIYKMHLANTETQRNRTRVDNFAPGNAQPERPVPFRELQHQPHQIRAFQFTRCFSHVS